MKWQQARYMDIYWYVQFQHDVQQVGEIVLPVLPAVDVTIAGRNQT